MSEGIISKKAFKNLLYKYRKPFWTFGIFCLFIFGLNILFPLNVQIPYSPIVLDQNNKILGAYLSSDDKWRFKTTKSDVSLFFVKAIIAKEDKYFYYHPGVNPLALVRALFYNTVKGKRVSGASTITMQVARMLNPSERTIKNKIIESFKAFQLELYFSKDQILGLYFSLLPYGSNIEGIKSASYILLQKHPSQLSLAEALILTVIPNQPSILRSGSNTPVLDKYKNYWLDFFETKKLFTQIEINLARNEKVSFSRRQLANYTPHLNRRLIQDSYSPYILSTIDLSVQKQIERISVNYLTRVKNQGVKNAMVIVIDNYSMEVKAYMGSADYAGINDGGQVDGIQSIRSPGSTLKPYLYAMGLEKGLINPKAKLLDIPSDFHGFVPENFDNQYRGQITAAEALQQSLNVPAVELLDRISVGEFVIGLKKANFSNIRKNEDNLGLSVILGGCGVTMEEMVRLYAALANKGMLQELKFLKNQKTSPALKLLDPASSYIISDILSGVQRPDFPNNFEFTFRLPRIVWKTGTSFGKRDAWAIGYNPDYTVGVWLGNFSGESLPQLSGAMVATPLLFQVFNLLPNTGKWFIKPPSLIYRNVCAVSGLPANDFCTDITTDTFVEGTIIKQKCSHLKKVMVNHSESKSYCGKCVDAYDSKTVYYLNPDVRYMGYLSQKGLSFKTIPQHNPDCISIRQGSDLKIISPRNKGIYFLDGKEEIELSAQSIDNLQQVIWYHNNKQIGSTRISKSIFIKPILGKNTISCTDKNGKTVSVWFEGKTF